MLADKKVTRYDFDFLPTADRQLVTDFVQYMRNGVECRYREDTIRTYVGHLATFFRRCEGVQAHGVVAQIERGQVMRFLTGIAHQRVSTRRNLLFAIKTFARFLHDWGLIEASTYQALAVLKFKVRHTPNRPCIAEGDAERLLRHIAGSPHYDEPERLLNLALVAMMGFTGLRNSEVCKLAENDVDFDAGVIRVVDGKGGKSRVLGLPDRIVPLLRLYLEHRGNSPAGTFFVGMTGRPLDRDLVIKRLGRLSRATGIKVGAHMLRRRFATHTAHKGVPLDKLQVVMGHADIQTTRGYVQTGAHEVAREMRAW